LERAFNGPRCTYCSCSESVVLSTQSIQLPRELLGRGNTCLEVLFQKSAMSWKGNTSSESISVHIGFKLAFQEPTIVFEEPRALQGINMALLMGCKSWTEVSLDGWKALQWFQQTVNQTHRVQVLVPHSWEAARWIQLQAAVQGAQPPGSWERETVLAMF